MRDIIKPSVTLFVICIIVAVCLAFTFSVTKATIDERAVADGQNARKTVLADADSFKKLEVIESDNKFVYISEAYQGLKGDTPAGYVMTVVSKGYGGAVEVVVGVDTKGNVAGVKIGNNSETPGLGSKAKDAPFISQFDKLSPKEPLKVVKGKKTKAEEIQAISGATITSRAVTGAVQTALDTAAELAGKGGAKK